VERKGIALAVLKRPVREPRRTMDELVHAMKPLVIPDIDPRGGL
jgi:hypothetical protein